MYRRGRMDRRRQQIPFATPAATWGISNWEGFPIVKAPHGSPYCSQLAAPLDGADVRLGSDPPHLHRRSHIDHSPHRIRCPPCGLGIKGDPPPSDLFFLQQLTHPTPKQDTQDTNPTVHEQPNSGKSDFHFVTALANIGPSASQWRHVAMARGE